MISLPKRGDRVRVTEGDRIDAGETVVLSEDSWRIECDWADGHIGFWVTHPTRGKVYSGAVKVEIPERADRFDCCGGSDEHPPEHTQDCSERPASERICADCGMPVTHRVHRGFGPCGGRSVRRAVEIAEGLPWQLSKGDYLVEKLKEAVEKELAK